MVVNQKKVNNKKDLGHLIGTNPDIIAVLFMILIGSIAYGRIFLNYNKNLINVLHTSSMIGIMGIGVNICFLIGARDMSVGAVGALASMVTAYLSPYGIFVSILGGLAAGLLFGVFNGIIIAKFKVQPFIATLGTQLAARGVALLVNNGLSISLGDKIPQLKVIGNGNLFGKIPIPTVIFVTIVIFFTIVLKYTGYGREVYAVGGDESSAEMMGVHVDWIKISVFSISGLMAALSGIVLCGRLSAGQPTACEGWEMTIMAAIVIGGTPVRGGLGKIKGIIFGSLFVNLITNLINLNGHLSAYWKDIITGVVLLIAVLVQVYADKQKEKIKHNRKLTVIE